MGWFHDLGKKISGAAHTLGTKLHHAGDRATKFIHKVAPKIKSVADEISKDAGMVGKAAASAIPFTAEIPIVGEVVAGVAAGAAEVSGAAKLVSKGAGMADEATRGIERVAKGAKGDAKKFGLSVLGKAARGDVSKEAIKGSAREALTSSFNRFVG